MYSIALLLDLLVVSTWTDGHSERGLVGVPAVVDFRRPSERLDRSQPVTFGGVGPVRIGMTRGRLLEILGEPVELQPEDNHCSYVLRPGEPSEISFMLIRGRVARIDVTARGFATLSGVRVGDPESAVMAAYPLHVEIREHAYEDGHYLTVRSDDGRFAVVFETDGKLVTRYRIGRLEQALWIEGCS